MPTLRFPEFREAPPWSIEPLGRLFDERQETGFPELPLLSVTDRDGVIPQDKTNRKNIANSNKAKYLRVVPGDIAYNTMRMWEGRSGRVGMEGVVSPAYTVCRPNLETNSYFFAYYFKTRSLIEQFRKYSQGLVKDTLNLKYEPFSLISVGFPLPNEQQKIADCLGSLDDLIAAESRKLEALRQHKQGLMQQLFPRPGETVPRLRFPEFEGAGDWEQKRLSSLVKLVSGVHLAPDMYSTTGEVPYFTGPSDFTDAIQCVAKWTAESVNIAKQHDTLITVKGSGVGEIWYLTLPSIAMGRQLMAVRTEVGDRRFIYQFLSTKRAQFKALASGNLIPGLARGDILGMAAYFPSRDEQKKIAECLTALDDQVAAQVRKLESLKQHKQGLLQKLFPSLEGH